MGERMIDDKVTALTRCGGCKFQDNNAL